jgi:hypothetical protein
MTGCSASTDHYSVDDFYRVEKIDAHLHINSDNGALIEQALNDNFKLLTVNVDYSGFPPVEVQQEIAISASKLYPDIVAFATTFHMAGWDDTHWQEQTMRHIESGISLGACAVKVWKNIGMEFRNSTGNFVMIDDPKFDAILNHLRKLKTVLIGHLGEPKSCWQPVEEIHINYVKEYFANHPQYHMYLHPELPSYEDQIEARDRMLEKNRDLDFVGAHLASLEWSVDALRHFLDRFPNAAVDMAARMGNIQYQSSQDIRKVRQFFIDYQDRILYATDLFHLPEIDKKTMKKQTHDMWLDDWKYLVTDGTFVSKEFPGTFQGLALPKHVVDKIYNKNAKTKFNNAW